MNLSWPDPASIEDISPHQREQIAIATSGRMGCLSGGPGCGKTHLAASLIKAVKRNAELTRALSGYERNEDERYGSWSPTSRKIVGNLPAATIAVAAPTGKAATVATQQLITRGVDIQATTIHTLLEISRNGHDGQGWEFRYGANNPLPHDFVFIDENSMVDIDLAAALLAAIGPKTHLLLIGDPYQLPPVGHGKPFSDMIAAGVPHGHLTEIWRYAGRIAHVCHAIKHGKPWQPSATIDLTAAPPENLKHIERRNADAILQGMLDIIQRMQERGKNVLSDVQIIVPLNESGPLCRKKVNEILQERLNPDGKRIKACAFRVGDKVACKRNQWMNATGIEATKDQKPFIVPTKNAQTYIANGDVGVVKSIDSAWMAVQFGQTEVRVTKQAWEHIELAYAITGHKSQGSQWPVVITLADHSGGAAWVCNRPWWYTVLSRASELCITVGKMETILHGCRKLALEQRVTFLEKDIRRCLEKQRRIAAEADPLLAAANERVLSCAPS